MLRCGVFVLVVLAAALDGDVLTRAVAGSFEEPEEIAVSDEAAPRRTRAAKRIRARTAAPTAGNAVVTPAATRRVARPRASVRPSSSPCRRCRKIPSSLSDRAAAPDAH
jgi:hypothetical protein